MLRLYRYPSLEQPWSAYRWDKSADPESSRYSDEDVCRTAAIEQWNLSIMTTFMIKFITCDLFNNVF